ncbi:MAG: outer membrane beta-barrel protein [Rudaea sp.]
MNAKNTTLLSCILKSATLALLPTVDTWAQTATSAEISDAPATDAVPTAMTTPSMAGPLTANPKPASYEFGAAGTWYVTGAVTGLALSQDNRAPGDRRTLSDLGNGQVFIQKTSGEFQFFVEVGAYSLPSLGTPYLAAHNATSAFYGVVPTAFVKYAPNDSFNIVAGKLPTLVGAENTYTFENMNIERGLLWNQENAVNRGVQANYIAGPLTASVWVNDGFYSNRYNWLWGSVAYAIDKSDTLSLIVGGNTDQTTRVSVATPLLQNNSQIVNLIYAHNDGKWTLTPYLQYTNVPRNADIGIARSASTFGAAMIASYAVTSRFSMASRLEYIGSSGNATDGSPSLIYGPGSKAWSLTLTPTYQYKLLFVRGELSYVKANSTTPGFALGADFNKTSQARAMIETGILF